jgi:hypothetical protein
MRMRSARDSFRAVPHIVAHAPQLGRGVLECPVLHGAGQHRVSRGRAARGEERLDDQNITRQRCSELASDPWSGVIPALRRILVPQPEPLEQTTYLDELPFDLAAPPVRCSGQVPCFVG